MSRGRFVFVVCLPALAACVFSACTINAPTAELEPTFNHQTAAFPLTGAHEGQRCQACHSEGIYRGRATVCVACHQSDYNGTTQPAHQAAGFPTDCTACHTTSAWPGATFDHQATAFPLTGKHLIQSCQACHSDGVYRGKPTACVSCHQSAYNGTTQPAHQAAGFPTDCTACHSTTAWLGATFDHDGTYFPIYSGKHHNQWSSCATCHTKPSAFTVFTCLVCHEHNQAKMNSEHKNKPGYQYQSLACLGCHPKGRKP